MSNNTQEYKIPVERVSEFKSYLKDISNKYHLEYSFKQSELIEDQRDVNIWGIQQLITLRYFTFTVELSSTEFQIEGFTYLGSLKKDPETNLFSVHGNEFSENKDICLSDIANDLESLPCNHCKTKQNRVISHVFLEKATQEIKLYGSGCAKKYFGINFLSELYKFERCFERFSELEDEYFTQAAVSFIDKKEFINICWYFIKESGYLSKSKCAYDELSTSEFVANFVRDTSLSEKQAIIKKVPSDLYERFINHEFVQNKDHMSDFDHNLSIVVEKVRSGNISIKDTGFLAYMVYSLFFFEEQKKQERKAINNDLSEFEGKEKVRLKELVLTITKINHFETDYGLTSLYTMIDYKNRQFKWFASKSIVTEHPYTLIQEGKETTQSVYVTAEIGDKIILDGTIKKLEDHEVYGPAVILTRCKVKKNMRINKERMFGQLAENEVFDQMNQTLTIL